MSTTILQEFLVKIGFKANTAELSAVNAGVAKAGVSAALLDKEATAAAASIQTKLIPSLRTMLLPLTAITAAVGLAYREMFHFVESSAEGFDEVSKLSNRVNSTATNILKLGYIAQVSGSSVEAARMSLDGLNKAAGETALGIGRAKKVFKEIGVSVKDSNGHLKDTGDLLLEIGDKIKGMERGKQLAVLEKLRIDPTLIETLTTDVSGLGKEFDDLYSAAGIDAEKAARSSQDFIDTLDKLKFVFKTIKDAIAVSFFDEFRDGAESFRKLMMHNLPKIIASLKPIITDMVKIGATVLKLGLIFGGVASNIISFITKINDLTGGWALKIAAITVAWRKLNLAFLVSPIGIILELATAISLLYDDYKVWERGGNSFIDWGGKAAIVVKAVTTAVSILKWEFKVIASFIEGVISVFQRLVSIIESGINTFIDFGKKIHDIFAGVYDDIEKVFGKASKLIDMLPSVNLGKGSSLGGLATNLYNPFASAPATNNKNITINHKTDINVNGTGNPYETATAVKNQQRAVYGDQIRNMQGAVR